jgi:predicted house-cleaning noncanonical NTP pyrophosphatase (MazG superfamily)
MIYDKLIRDKIPEIIRNNNKNPITHTASEEEYKEKLYKKLEEEVKEFLKEDNTDELADILEVYYAILELKNISKEQIEKIRKEKAEKRGSFKNRLILEEVK